MGYIVSITEKGQMTIPKPIRDALGLKPGMRIKGAVVDIENRIITLEPIKKKKKKPSHSTKKSSLR